jgi:hypothetical protein
MGQEWYVQTSSGKDGPFASAELRQLAQAGKIAPESLVSLDGKNWSAASRVKGLVFADTPPTQGPPEPPPADEYALAEDDRKKPTVDRPGRKTPVDDAAAEVLLYKSSGDAEEDFPALSTAAGLPARFGVSFILAAVAASAVAALVKLTRMLGLVELNTTATSLAARVGLPAIAFVGVFAFIFWYCGREAASPKITGDMSDEEIGEAIRRF